MNTKVYNLKSARALLGVTVASVLLAACASAPTQPQGAVEARSKLMQLQSEQDLAARAPLAIKDADGAVRDAELPTKDAALAVHRVYIADRRIDIARAQAEARLAEDQRAALSEERQRARLDARTREADAAKSQAAQVRGEADAAADAARLAAASAVEQAAELQRQIDVLEARPTDRGLVLTLGDVLFSTGRADLKSGASSNLDKLVGFLGKYPSRRVMIEGHTDNVGSDDYNQSLSQRRADSVRSYLAGQGVAGERLTATGKGEGSPVAGNDSASGRQQNRRVEVVITNPIVASK